MYQIHYLNKISPKGTALWRENYQLTEHLPEADGILVRSAAMHDMVLPEKLLAVAPVSTTFPWISAQSRASWCSIPPVPTPAASWS